MSGIFPSRTVGLFLLALNQGAFAMGDWDVEQATRQASHPAVAEQVAQMLYLTPLLPAAAIQDQIDAVINDPNLGEPAREKILRDYAWKLRELAPDAVALGSLQSLAAYRAVVLVVHPESRGQKTVPLFDVASAAQGTINRWLRESARDRAAAELAQGSMTFILELAATAHYQQIAGIPDINLYQLDVYYAVRIFRIVDIMPEDAIFLIQQFI